MIIRASILSLVIRRSKSSAMLTVRYMLKLINSRDLRNGDSLNLRIQHVAVLLTRKRHRAYAYINHCPHLGLSLERQAHNFLNNTGDYIQCVHHGALFDIATGRCISGPCLGAQLQTLRVTEFDGAIWTEQLRN